MKTRVKRFFKPPFTLELAATKAIWIYLEVNGDGKNITIGAGIFIGFYLTVKIGWKRLPWPTRASVYYPGERFGIERDTSLYIWSSPHFWETSLAIRFWRNEDAEQPHEWKGLSWARSIGDLRGDHTCEWEEMGYRKDSITLPEGEYTLTIRRSKRTDRWRFWLSKTTIKFEVFADSPIPVPGKGTTAYNCGDDSVYSMYMGRARSYEEAVRVFAEEISRTRDKYGGKDWVASNSNEK